MKIVLSGVETNNKGAELMMYAILQEIESRFPKAIVYVEPNSIPQGLDYVETSLVLRQKPVVYFYKICARLHLYKLMISLFGKDVFDDIYAVPGTDFFLNDSGFYYSDKWNLPLIMINQRKKLLKANYKRGAKIVFLPQAFGPISQENVKEGLADLQKYASLVMPREAQSLNFLSNTNIIDSSKVRLYPDFTSLVSGKIPDSYKHLEGGVCIIPNVRMLDKGDLVYEEYRDFVHELVRISLEKGHTPYILNHEGRADRDLACQLCKDYSEDIEFVDGLNALEVKGVISTAYLVITSRFHGAASALNCGVPCLCTSWGHKYEELFQDFKQDNCVLSVRDMNNTSERVSFFLDKQNNIRIREMLVQICPDLKQKSKMMWNEVWGLHN